jgi:hypothetical protein
MVYRLTIGFKECEVAELHLTTGGTEGHREQPKPFSVPSVPPVVNCSLLCF